MTFLSDTTIFRDIIVIGGSFTFCGCMYMILTFLLCKNLRRDPIFKSIIYLIFIDIQFPIWGYLQLMIPARDNYRPCELLACYDVFLRLCSVFWTKIFADSVYWIIVKKQQIKFNPFTLIFGAVLVPLIMAIIPFLMGYYGVTGLICAFNNNLSATENFMIAMGFYFLPFWGIFIYNLVVFWRIALHAKTRFGDMKTFYKLILYPLTLLPVNLLTFFYKIEVVWFGKVSTSVEIAYVALLIVQGFLNTLMYGVDSAVRTEVGNFVSSICHGNAEQLEEKQIMLSNDSHDSTTFII